MRYLLAILLLAGCPGPSFCKTVTVPAQRVTICGPEYVNGQAGPGLILSWGWWDGAQVVPDPWMLGHEFQHQLNREDWGFKNPDWR